MLERLPPDTVTSPLVPSQAKDDPGSSEKVNVIVAVSPLLRVEAVLLMARDGAWVSKVSVGELATSPSFPAGSV
jgi:hypothetical protein